MRIFFATDLHASEKCFRKFLNAAKVYQANVLVLGGDITGKMIIPIIRTGDKWRVKRMGIDAEIKTEDEVRKTEVSIRDGGYYPYLTDENEMEALNSSPSAIADLFKKLMLEQVERWVKLAEERLAASKVRLYMTGGNDDPLEIESVLEASTFVVDPEGRVVDIGEGHEMVSSGYGNITPWKCPRDVDESQLLQKIETAASQVKDKSNSVFNLHVPPYDSGLDSAPKLDAELKPMATPGMGVEMVPVGSTSVRKVIEQNQPLLGLHGHIHESRGAIKIGRTLCINPGSEYGESILHGALIDLDRKGITSYVLTTG